MNVLFKILVSTSACYVILAGNQAWGQKLNLEITIDPNKPPIKSTIDLDEKPAVGASDANPIVFKKIKNYHAFEIERDNYIRKHYEGYRVTGKGMGINKAGRLIQDIMLKDDEDKCIFVFFDADDVCRKYKKLDDKDLAEGIKRLLELDEKRKTEKHNPYPGPTDKCIVNLLCV